jgi:hypothetical protein
MSANSPIPLHTGAASCHAHSWPRAWTGRKLGGQAVVPAADHEKV